MFYDEIKTETNREKIRIKIFYLPILFMLFFIGQSGFGKGLFQNMGLDFILLIVFVLIYIRKIKFIPPKVRLTHIVLILYTLIITIIGEDYKNWFVSIATLSVIAVFVNMDINLEELKFSLLMTSCLGVMVLIIYNYTNLLINLNPNSVGTFASFAILSILLLYKIEKKYTKKILYFLLILLSAYVIFLTKNRNSLLVFFIAFIAVALIPEKKWNNKKIYIFFIIGISASLIIPNIYRFISQSSFISAVTNWVAKISGKNTLLSGRDDFWIYCMNLIEENFIFGRGKSLYNYIYAHNMYFSIVYFFGIIGYILYAIFLFSTISETIKNKSFIGKYCVLIFIAILFGQIMENSLFTANSNIFMPYIYISIGLNRMIREGENTDEINNNIHTDI